jgi:hypothetical protein
VCGTRIPPSSLILAEWALLIHMNISVDNHDRVLDVSLMIVEKDLFLLLTLTRDVLYFLR